jgi:hypothetical protein
MYYCFIISFLYGKNIGTRDIGWILGISFRVETKKEFLIFAKSLIIYIFRDISDAKALSVSINVHILYKKEIVIPSLDIWDTNQRLFRTMGVRKTNGILKAWKVFYL